MLFLCQGQSQNQDLYIYKAAIKRKIMIQWKLNCQRKFYILLHNQICTYYKQCSGCFSSIYNCSVGFWNCSDSVVCFWLFILLSNLYLTCILYHTRKTYQIRTYPLNKAFWLDNIEVRIQNLYLIVLWLKAS